MTGKDDTGFDAFFQAVTRSPEFRTAMTKDWKKDSQSALEDSLREMQKGTDEAGKLMDALQSTFATEDAKAIGESLRTDSAPQAQESRKREQEEKMGEILKVEYFEMKNPETYGFKGIAGMQDLKKELQESFIAPLRFKFLIAKLERENVEGQTPDQERPGETQGKPATDETRGADAKLALYRRLHEEYEKFKVSIPTGLLFYGPPGTGKTFITKKLAEELHAGFVQKSVGEFGSSYMHETTKNIKAFFEAAKSASQKGPILLFLDEIDSLLSSRTDRIDANKAEEISQFLQEFNALSEAQNLIVVAATNRPDHLDSAILRSGRLDKKFYIAPPDFIARREMFRLYIEKEGRPHGKIDYEELAQLTEGYVSADIEAICDEVARDAGKAILKLADSLENTDADLADLEKSIQGNAITMAQLRKAITETTSSLKMVDMSIYTKWLEKIG